MDTQFSREKTYPVTTVQQSVDASKSKHCVTSEELAGLHGVIYSSLNQSLKIPWISQTKTYDESSNFLLLFGLNLVLFTTFTDLSTHLMYLCQVPGELMFLLSNTNELTAVRITHKHIG